MREVISNIFKRSTLTFMSLVLAFSSLTPLASAQTANAESATSEYFTVATSCGENGVKLTLTGHNPLPINAYINKYSTPYGSDSRHLWEMWTIPNESSYDFVAVDTHQIAIPAGTASAHVPLLGWLPASYPATNCDTEAPSITVNTPDNALNPGVVSATATDNHLLSVVTAHVYNEDLSHLELGCSKNVAALNVSTYDLSCDVTSLPSGVYTIKAVAVDQKGLWSPMLTDTQFVIDESVPTVVFDSPANNASVHDLKVDVTMDGTLSNLTQYGFDVTGPNGVHFSTSNYSINQPSLTLNDFDLCVAAHYGTCPSTLPEGTYTIRAKAYDAGGNRNISTSLKVVVDNTAPENFTAGLSSYLLSAVNGNPFLTGTITDSLSTIDHVNYAIWARNADGSKGTVIKNWTNVPAADGAYDEKTEEFNTQLSLDLANLDDGKYIIGVRGFDSAQNKASAGDFVFTVDNTAPTITVKDNYVGNLASKIFSNVSFKLYDAQKVDKYVLNGWTSDFTNNNWSDANFDNIKSHLVQGENTLTLYDVAGNSSAYTFNYDSVAPTATLSYSPSTLTNGNVTVTLTANEPIQQSALTGTWLKVNDSVYKKVYPANATQVQVLKDVAGNVGSATVVIDWIDKTAPSVPTNLSFAGLNGYVASGDSTNSKTGTLSWEHDNPNDVSKYVYKFWTDIPGYFEGQSNAWTTDDPQYFTGSSIWTNFEHEGKFFFCVEAVDAAGNASACSDTYDVTYDNTAPGVPEHQTPFNNAVQNVNDFWFQWKDVEGAVSYETQYSQDPTLDGDGAFANVQWTGDYTQVQPTASEAHSVGANGTWYWQVRALDAAGNKSAWSAPWKLSIDMVAPAAPTLVGPADNTPINGTSPVANDWNDVADADHYVYQSYNVNGDGTCNYGSIRFTGTYTDSQTNSRTLADGLVYCWRVKAVDAAGNESAWSDTWTTVVDNTPPALSLNAVESNSNTSRTFTGTTDPFAEVTVTVHSTPQTKVTTADVNGNWSATFDNLEVGSHVVKVSSKDAAGNETTGPEQSFEVTEVPANPQGNSTDNNSSANDDQALLAFNNDTAAGDNQTDGDTAEDGEVLAAQDVKKNVAATDTVKADGTWNIAGIAWYWILAILAALAAAWWLIAAWRRRQNEA